MSGLKLLFAPILLLLLLLQSTSGDEICGVNGYNLGTLYEGDYWTMRFKTIQDCMLPLNVTENELEVCNLYISVCKSLGGVVCPGHENSTTCQEVILRNGTKVYYDMGIYTGNGEFQPLRNVTGFTTQRMGGEPIESEECNGTISTILTFSCDINADWDLIGDHNASKYLVIGSQLIGLQCTYYIQVNYSGACYIAPTLSPSHCSLNNYDTDTLSKNEYWLASVPPSSCYHSDSTSCMFFLSFCHPIPIALGGEVCYDSAVCQDSTFSNSTRLKLSMGTYANYTRFIENDENFDQGGFHMTVDNGSRPDNHTCNDGLKTTVIMNCNKSAKWDNLNISEFVQVAYHHADDPCMYVLEIQYEGACKQTSQSAPYSPVGWIFMGIFAFSVLGYLVIGSLYMYFVKHKTGVNIIPNYMFWSDFLVLVLEGCGFFLNVITCFQIKGKSVSFQSRQPDYDKI